jgi:DNA (cytosine-5)-methyltransferase 1
MMSEELTTPKTVASLFAGVGGFEKGLERAGYTIELQCEVDEPARRVLADRFGRDPVGDVRDLSGSDLAGIDLLTAGFPCQDLSQAGTTRGIGGEKSGIVTEVFRLLRERPVPWVLFENVPFMLSLDRGRAIEAVVSRLEALGYRWAYRVIDTRAFGIPQRRKRVFVLASLEEDPEAKLLSASASPQLPEDHAGRPCGFYWTEGNTGLGWAVDSIPTLKGGSGLSIPSAPAVWLPSGPIVTPSIESAEALQGFEPGWTEPAEEVRSGRGRWKLVGNAVTVDVAAWLGECIGAPGRPFQAIPVPLAAGHRWPGAAYGSAEKGRFALHASTFPTTRPLRRLEEFLVHGVEALSLRATSGFYRRLSASRLSYPAEFGKALERHIERMERGTELEIDPALALQA